MSIAPALRTPEPRLRDISSRLPGWRTVLVEQIRATGFTLRRPMQVVVALGLFFTISIAFRIANRGLSFDLNAEPSPIYGLIGALLPIVVWARDERFGPGFLWTLPVDRRQHALTKVFAGWLWLMGGVAASLLWLIGITLASGGDVLPPETLQLLTNRGQFVDPIDPALLTAVQWDPGLLIGLVPFTAATVAYVSTSALWLGVRHPWRWLLGAVLAFAFVAVAIDIADHQLGMEGLSELPGQVQRLIVEGRYGLDALLSARTATLDTSMRLPSGERVSVWSAVPDVADWGFATLIWGAIGVVALVAAVARHRELRHA